MATPSFAAQMLTNLEAALLKLSSGTNATADFNGQTYTKKDVTKLLEQRSQMRIEVQAENAAGTDGTAQFNQGRRVLTRFVNDSYGPGYPYPRTGPQ